MRYLQFAAYACIPLAFAVHYSGLRAEAWEPMLTFALAGTGIVPLAWLIGEATAQLAGRAGSLWGGLLNATFGNVTELIIGVIALSQGLNSFVKASLIGSILGNVLLVAGGAMIVGGWNRERQTFSRAAIEAYIGLLFVGLAGMLAPAIFHFSYRLSDPALAVHENRVSVATSIILIAVYGLAMLFTLKTHAHALAPAQPPSSAAPLAVHAAASGELWSVKKSIFMLLLATIGVAIISELLVGSADLMSQRLAWNRTFVGAMLLALVGNAAEHSSAILLARRNDMNTAMTIVYQSSLQIALFVTPLLVLVSWGMIASGMGHSGKTPMSRLDLVFSALEVAAVILAVGIATVLGLNGECNWFEGALLIAVWAILAVSFFYIPEPMQVGYDAPGIGPAERVPALAGEDRPASEATGHAAFGQRISSP